MARGNVRVSITADADGMRRGIRDAERALDRLNKGSRTAFGAMGRAAGIAGTALGGGLAVGLASVTSEAQEALKASKQTEAVIKSTGGVAKVTAKEVANLAEQISLKSGIDDEAIQSGANLLLTFKDIRNEAGKGNDIFSQATEVITDLSVAMGQDMKSSTIQVGKALNDPIKGITALRRVGIQFTESQENQIRTLVESNRKLDAQKIILKELESQFGGSAEAQATSLDKARVAVDNLQEAIGLKLAPIVASAADGLARFVTQMQTGEGAGGRFRDRVVAIAHGIGDVASRVAAVVGPLAAFVVGLHNSQTAMTLLTVAAGALTGRLVGLGVAFAVGKVIAFGQALATMGRQMALVAGTALIQLRTGLIGGAGLGAALGGMAGPIGILVGGLAGLGLALFGMKQGSDTAKVSADELTAALRRQEEATRAVRDLDLDLAQRKANLTTANNSVTRAEQQLTEARRQYGRGSLQAKEAEAQLEQAKIQQERAQRDLSRAEDDGKRTRQEAAAATEDALNKNRSYTQQIEDLQGELKREEAELRKTVALHGENSSAADAHRDKIASLRSEINKLKSKKVEVKVDLKFLGGAGAGVGAGIGSALGADGQRDGPGFGKWAEGQVRAQVQKMAKDGSLPIGVVGGAIGGGGLVAVGRRLQQMGYHVSEHPAFGGVRGRHTPGSFHYRGRAIDVNADGHPRGEGWALDRIMPMLRALHPAELLWRTAGHYDHLHLAMRSGGSVPGSGSGDKVPALLEPGEVVVNRRAAGSMPGFFEAFNRLIPRFQRGGRVGIGGLVGLAQRAGFRGTAAARMAAEAMGESGGNPRARGDGGMSHGLWQIHTPSHPELARRFNLFDPWGNARAARQVYLKSGRSFSPWHADHRPHMAAALRALRSGGGGVPVGRGDGRPGRGGTIVDAPRDGDRVEPTDFGQPLPDVPVGRPGAAPKDPMKGFTPAGRAKGSRPVVGETQPADAADLPSATDHIDRDIAMAQLTPGTGDDLAAFQAAKRYWEGQLAAALLTPDPRDDTVAAQGLKQVIDAIASLQGAIEDNTAQERDLWKQAAEEARRETRVIRSNSQTIIEGLIDVVSGGIGGRIGLGFQTPSSLAAYGGVK